jgi:hypothetical protein
MKANKKLKQGSSRKRTNLVKGATAAIATLGFMGVVQ